MESELQTASELIGFTMFNIMEFYIKNETSTSRKHTGVAFEQYIQHEFHALQFFETLVDTFKFVGFPHECLPIVVYVLQSSAEYCRRTNIALTEMAK